MSASTVPVARCLCLPLWKGTALALQPRRKTRAKCQDQKSAKKAIIWGTPRQSNTEKKNCIRAHGVNKAEEFSVSDSETSEQKTLSQPFPCALPSLHA